MVILVDFKLTEGTFIDANIEIMFRDIKSESRECF